VVASRFMASTRRSIVDTDVLFDFSGIRYRARAAPPRRVAARDRGVRRRAARQPRRRGAGLRPRGARAGREGPRRARRGADPRGSPAVLAARTSRRMTCVTVRPPDPW